MDKETSKQFNMLVGEGLYYKIKVAAAKNKMTAKQWITKMILEELSEEKVKDEDGRESV